MKYDYQFLKDYLLYYLQTYLSRRHIVMKDFMTNIKAEIENDRPISLKQFKVLLKYLMKEKQFENATKRQVTRVFKRLFQLAYGTHRCRYKLLLQCRLG